jgi:hypothetical protein
MVTTAYLARTNFFCPEMYEPLAALHSVWLLSTGFFAHTLQDVERFLDFHNPDRQHEIYNSLLFTIYFLSSSLPLNGFQFPNPCFENMRFTVGSPYRPYR